MSKCMTIADETIDQKDTCPEITPKDIVDFILEEALLSAFIVLDKGCSRIGDFNVTEDFRQQYDQLPHLKDFEQVDHTQSGENQESNLDSGETVDRTARENLEQIIDSFVKKEEKIKPGGECTVISEDVLANNELQIQNGQILLGKNDKVPEHEGKDFVLKEDVVADEKIEIEFFNEGKLNKIYVPLNPSSSSEGNRPPGPEEVEGGEEKKEKEEKVEKTQDETKTEEDPERPFKPFTTEELRQSTLQVWGSESCSLVGKWDGDALVQGEEAVRLMEELSSVHVFPDSAADPNRPRACSFAEEDVKKMIKEIEEINFTQCVANSEDSDVAYYPEGQGDADLDSKPSSKSKDNIAKPEKNQKSQEELLAQGPFEFKTRKEFLGEQHQDEGEATGQSTVFFSNMLYSVTPEPTSMTGGNHEPDLEPLSEEQILLEENEGMASSLQGMPGLNYVDMSPKTIQNDFSCTSFLKTGKDITQNESEIFPADSINPKDFQIDQNECDEFFPDTMSLSGNIGSLSRCKLDDLTFKNLEFPSELDIGVFEEKHSDLMKESRRVIDTLEMAPGSSSQIQQGTSSLGRLNASSSETYKRLNVDSFSEENDLQFLSVDTNLYVTNAGEIRASQDPGNFFQESSSLCGIPRNDRNSGFITGGLDPNLEEAINVREKSGESFINFQEKRASDLGKFEEEGTQQVTEGTDEIPAQTAKRDSDKSLQKTESENEEVLSRTPSRTDNSNDSNDSVYVPGETSGGLHSQKMYWGTKYELRGQCPDEFTLTESEEAFIDMTESVIQIIEPPENSSEEDSNKILFSLLSDSPTQKLSSSIRKSEEDFTSDKSNSELEHPTKREYSGMTTIGPIKSSDHDPKDLTAPEVDFGKMTRITSSRQLAKDLGLFSAEVTAIKIVEEDDSDEEVSGGEEDRLEHTSLVNRDIASLTKVQKIREVMSYHPKPEEDFEDDDAFTRPRLDLKNVESMTDERYKVPDVGVPILSLELGEGNLEAEKELIDSIGLVISGLTEPAVYEEENEVEEEVESVQGGEPKVEAVKKRSSKTVKREKPNSGMSAEEENKPEVEVESKESSKMADDSESLHKFGTLGGVFRKASSKFLRKEGDLSVRNTKSLPRDSYRINATESIRSIIDDCHSSASNVLKKSRSLLKNTQSMFKSVSQSRMSSDPVSGPSPDPKKLSPSESDVSTIERKFSGFLKKEDFTKAKNLIKDKVEKTLKSFEVKKPSAEEMETPVEKKELRVAVRNKENLQVDRMENFKKLLPKSPLVYKSQFVKSQVDVQSRAEESASATSSSMAPEQHESMARSVSAIVFKDSYENIPAEPTEVRANDPPFQEKLQWINVRENVEFSKNKELEPQQPEYIIMETVEGLPATDLESPSSEKENLSTGKARKAGIKKEGKKMSASDSSKIISDVVDDFSGADEEKMDTKAPSESKTKTKKKKFPARFWNFWCSAFGKVKTPPAKGDLP